MPWFPRIVGSTSICLAMKFACCSLISTLFCPRIIGSRIWIMIWLDAAFSLISEWVAKLCTPTNSAPDAHYFN